MFNKILDSIEEIICIICTVVMVCITFANVICRWTGIGSLAFSEEIATYLFILLSMMGTAIAAKRRAHLGLTVLPDAVNFKARKALLVFVYGLATVFSALLVYYGILMVINQYNLGMVTSAMQWPEWIYATFVPFGAVFVTIRFAQATIQEARVKPESTDGKEELSK